MAVCIGVAVCFLHGRNELLCIFCLAICRSCWTKDLFLHQIYSLLKHKHVENKSYAVTHNSGVNVGVASTLQNLYKIHRGIHCAGFGYCNPSYTKNLQLFQNGGKVRGNCVPVCI